jgi:EmrB/QacA subfamily drug resistance transporter
MPASVPAVDRPLPVPRRARRRAGPAAAAPPGATAAPRSTGGWLPSLAVVVVGMFMAVLDTSIVNVAIPTIQTQFGASTDDVQWVATAYTLAMGVVVPVSGWLGDRFGLKRIYGLALVLFSTGSALCGLSWNLPSLVVFRILQAIGGGLLPAISMAMVYRLVPRERIGMAMGLYGLGIVFAPALGPTLGGYLVEYVDWRLIFYINVPIGAAGLVAALAVLRSFPAGTEQRLDVAGLVTISSSLFCLLLALSEGSNWGWSSYSVLLLFTAGAILMAIFVIVELSVPDPMLDLRLFRIWAFTNSTVLTGIMMAGLFAGFFYVPLFLQEGQGTTAFLTGLTLLPSALVTAVMMPISGRLYDRIGARWPAAIGLLVTAAGTYLMHGTSPDTTRLQFVTWMSIRSLGMGLAMMPIMTGALAVVPTPAVGRASALSNIVQRSSAALGLALLTAVLTSQQAQQFSGRRALLPAVDPGSPSVQGMAGAGPEGTLGLISSVQVQVFGSALGDLFLLTAGITALAALLALMLPPGPVRPAPASPAAAPAPAPRQETYRRGSPEGAPG